MEHIESFFSFFDRHKDGVISLGVFVAAAATLLGSVLATRISSKSARKERMGQLREEWVDELRDDLAELLKVPFVEPDGHVGDFRELNYFASKVRMRLTGGDENHDKLSQAISSFVAATVAKDEFAMSDAGEDVIEAARVVLKEAWLQASKDLA